MNTQSRLNVFLFGTAISALLFCVPFTLAQSRKASPANERDRVIMEIIEEDRGLVTIPGEFIYFRLYQSGRAEFEDIHHQEHLKYKFEKHELELSPEEKQQFVALTQQSDLRKG